MAIEDPFAKSAFSIQGDSIRMLKNRRRNARRASDTISANNWQACYAFLFQNCSDSIFLIRGRDRQILEANATAIEICGYSQDELRTMTLDGLLAPSFLDGRSIEQLCRDIATMFINVAIMKKSGEIIPVEMTGQKLSFDPDELMLVIASEQAETCLARINAEGGASGLRGLLDAISESFYLTDRDGTIVEANETFAKRMRVSLDKIIGASLYDLLPADVAIQRRQQVENVVSNARRIRFEELRNRRYVDQVIHPICNDEGEVVRLAFFGADVTKRREMEKELEALAFDDQLTGLYNRRGFFTLGKRELGRTRRSEKPLLVFFADLDGLKAINDQFGHEEGDRALIGAAKLLKQTFRSLDIVARIGGDEFAVIAVDASEEVRERLLRRLYRLINQFNARKDQPYRLSISIGHTLYDPANPTSLDDLLSLSDREMYKMKRIKNRRE